MTEHSELLARMLGRQPIFRSLCANSIGSAQDYSIFLGVPAHCLTVQNCSEKFPNGTIDLLICRGREAVLAIVVDGGQGNMEPLFFGTLQCLPHVMLRADSLNEAVAEDFCEEIGQRLSHDRSDPLHTGCVLQYLRISSAISRMDEPEITSKIRGGYHQFLEEKHLITDDGSVTAYARACGMFQRWIPSRERRDYMTVSQCVGTVKNAMLWRDSTDADMTLKTRLARLKQGLPSRFPAQKMEALQKLLQTPLEELFRNYSQDGQLLRQMLSRGQFLSRESAVSAFGDREEINTYADVIYVVKNLAEYTAWGGPRNVEAAKIIEQILFLLSCPLWTYPTAENTPPAAQLREKPGLQTQLEQLNPGVYDMSFALMPLQHYFYTAACLTESEYPLWVYQNSIQPRLNTHASGETSFAGAMQTVYRLFRSAGEKTESDAFPLIYHILVEPVSGMI